MKNIRRLKSIILAAVFFVIATMPSLARGDPDDFATMENFFRNLPKSVLLVVAEDNSGPASATPVGTAFIITKEGELITNAHVIAGKNNFRVFFNNDGIAEKRSARVILMDKFVDIAVLKIVSENNETFESLSFGDPQELVAGYSEITIAGYPPALGGKSQRLHVGHGRVTQKEALLDGTDIGLGPYIGTNVVGGRGNSGSPCLYKNKVIGVAAVIFSPDSSGNATGPVMCISATSAKHVLEKAIAGEPIIRGYVHIDIMQFSSDIIILLDQYKYIFPEEPRRVVVVNGYNSGLRPLDRILSVSFLKEGKRCSVPIFRTIDFKRMLGTVKPNSFITMTIIRAGKEMSIQLLVESRVQENTMQNPNQPH